MKQLFCAGMIVAMCATPAVAQNPPAKPAPAPTQPGPPATPPRITPQRIEPINIRYEIRINEEGGGQKPNTRTVSMMATANAVSSVRAMGGPLARNPLNVDIEPFEIRNQKIRTKVSIEYQPVGTAPADLPTGPPGFIPTPLTVRQTVMVWLDSGKPMVVSQSADPASDRRLSIDVTATILP